jgi:hypothetical protein
MPPVVEEKGEGFENGKLLAFGLLATNPSIHVTRLKTLYTYKVYERKINIQNPAFNLAIKPRPSTAPQKHQAEPQATSSGYQKI